MAPWFEVFAVGQRNCREQAWVLKNSFQGISITKFVRKLLNVRSPQTLEFAEITALVPFSTPTPDFASCLDACFDRAISIANFDKLVVVVNRPAAGCLFPTLRIA